MLGRGPSRRGRGGDRLGVRLAHAHCRGARLRGELGLRGGGLGWFIYERKNDLDIPAVFAGLFTVILIGLAVENLIFRNIEARTVRKWGMQH